MMMLAAALAAALSYRVVPLACTPDGLAISGGAVLRIAPDATCTGIVAGRAITVTLDDQQRVTPQKLDPASHPASELPREAYAIAPTSTAAPQAKKSR